MPCHSNAHLAAMTRKPKRCLIGWNPGVNSVSESLNQWREALKVCQTSPTTCTRWRCRPMIFIAKLQSVTQRSPSGLYRRLRRKIAARKHRTVFLSRRSVVDEKRRPGKLSHGGHGGHEG